MKNEIKNYAHLIKEQFKYGGKKYKGEKKEATDLLVEDFGKNWLFGTMGKYCKRFLNIRRERDLLKIATYCYLLWLKRGFHLSHNGLEEIINTTIENKNNFFDSFTTKVTRFILFNYMQFEINNRLDIIYEILKQMAKKDFFDIEEREIFIIFASTFNEWLFNIKEKGGDQDINNEKYK